MSNNDFDWNDADTQIRRGHGDLAVYANRDGDVIIRQASVLGEEDSIVLVPRYLASWIIAAIEDQVGKVTKDLQRSESADRA